WKNSRAVMRPGAGGRSTPPPGRGENNPPHRSTGGTDMRRPLIALFGLLTLGLFAAPATAQEAKGAQAFAAQKCSICHSIAGKRQREGPARRRRLEAERRSDSRVDCRPRRHDRETERRA